MTGSEGKVYLVGAGPGDPRLLTLRAAECIRHAEVIVYDRLIPPRIEQMASPEAHRIYVGKASREHTVPQQEICQRLIDLARQGYQVVRLKGGDPFVFGRGGEEAEELAAAGIYFEIVPGVTSAAAVPAYAGIPLTHRDYASSLAVITGHAAAGKENSNLNYSCYAESADTLVFLMGVENLENITGGLQEGGLPSSRPAAIIRWGTRADQKMVKGTLGEISKLARQEGVMPPAVLVVGNVVSLSDRISWREFLPLHGKRVVITRPAAQASELSGMIEKWGGEAWEFPAIKIAPPESWDKLDECCSRLKEYSWVVFTSVNGVVKFFERLWELSMDIRELAGLKLAAIGSSTCRAIENRGLKVDFVPDEFRAERVAEGLIPRLNSGEKILLPRAEVAREILPGKLREEGWNVDEVPAYRAVSGEGDGEALLDLLREKRVDVITFTSSSTVHHTLEKLGEEGARLLNGVVRASIGPITSETLKEKGLTPQVEAEEYTMSGLVQALLYYYKDR